MFGHSYRPEENQRQSLADMVNLNAIPNQAIQEIFQDGGDLSKILPRYSYRHAQHTAAQMGGHAFRLRRHAVIEAPTGVGKSLSGGVPAVLHSLESKMPVVISTSNNTLTSQLLNKDLPLLASALAPRMQKSHGRGLRYMLAVGRANFLCKNALRILKNSGRADQYLKLLESVEEWESTTESGYMDDNPILGRNNMLKAKLAATRENCVGRRHCIWESECHFYNLKDSWGQADIIVTNHTMLAIALMMPGEILPEFDGFVIDEAHQLDRIVTDQLTVRVNPAKFSLQMEAFTQKTQVDTFQIEMQFGDWFRAEVRERGRAEYPAEVVATLKEYVAKIETEPHLVGLRDSLSETVQALQNFCRPSLSPNRASWVDKHEDTGHLSIKSAPLSSAKFLREKLWKKPGVVCSATMATCEGEGAFDFIKERLGLETKLCLQLKSAFDWNKNCLYIFPQAGALKESDSTKRNSETHDQWAKRWADKITPTIAAILKKTQGRAFVICTTTKVFQNVHQNLVALRLPFPMKAQGELPQRAMIEWFKSTPNPVLVATASYREGVDIDDPDQLVCVILDRLEFPNQNLELEAARMKSYGDRSFPDYQLPHCQFVTRQTAGRLIRSTRHRGIFCLLDPKVHTKAYVRKTILSALPGDAVAALNRVGPVDITGFLGLNAAPMEAETAPEVSADRHDQVEKARGLFSGRLLDVEPEQAAEPFSWGADLEEAWAQIDEAPPAKAARPVEDLEEIWKQFEDGPRQALAENFRPLAREQAGWTRDRLSADSIRAALGGVA